MRRLVMATAPVTALATALATALVTAQPGTAQAGTVTDGIEVTFSGVNGSQRFSETASVGAGEEFTRFGATIDVNAGANGDLFEYISPVDTGRGVVTVLGPTTLTIDGLSFEGGRVLTGFLLTESLFAPGATAAVEEGAVVIRFNENRVIPGVVFRGQYITAAVPLPASAWLMLAGLGGLGLAARRLPSAGRSI